MGVAHRQKDGVIVLDAVREVRPKFSPESVVAEFSSTFKSYRIGTIYGDDYGGDWPKERFSRNGIKYISAKKPRSNIYKEFAELLRSHKVQLLDHDRMLSQIRGLERRVAPGGNDTINHAPNSHDMI